MTKWVLRQNDANIELMAETLKLNPITACVLANRNIRTKNTALKFLNPLPSYMHDPALFKDIDEAVHIINDSIRLQEKIVIYGDYDVDGIASTVILYKALRTAGANVSYYVPHREKEGYGLNISAIDKLNAFGVKLVVTCDNGISASAEIDYLKKLGKRVIIIDHHEPAFAADADGVRSDIIPKADAIINPKQKDCPYPFKDLCAAGICFKFSQYFYQYNNSHTDNCYTDKTLLVFAAIATFCDIVNLTGENRIIAKTGLQIINDYQFNNLGLDTLIRHRQLKDKKIDAFGIGFLIGPCINATGRLESAYVAVELFLTESGEQAEALAKRLVDLNNDRKTLTAQAVETVMQEALNCQNDKVLIIYNPSIHESIAGIVAGRIKDSLNHPTIVFSKSGNLLKGSARSVEGYNIFEALYACKDLFERFGGHPMAAGLSLKEENLQPLKVRLNDSCELQDFTKSLYFDKEISLNDVSTELAMQLQILQPYGKENKEPVFVTKRLFAQSVEIIGAAKTTLRFAFPLESGGSIKGICFGKSEQFAEALKQMCDEQVYHNFMMCGRTSVTLDIAYCIEINEFKNSSQLQLRIIDFIL